MFTGIIEEVGRVSSVVSAGGKRRITISSSSVVRELRKGDSIAVSGVCLTAVELKSKTFSADLAAETWNRTSLSRLKDGALVNLELPMRADGRLGGHIVQGHVDGTGKLLSFEGIPGAADYRLDIEIPSDLTRYVIFKGSLSIEGISLTVAKIKGTKVTVAIIPHTAESTNLKSLKPGDPVNIEVDMLAKYAEKRNAEMMSSSPITLENLLRHGF